MAGVGQEVSQTAVNPASLVTPADPNVVSSDAVRQLVDAYHKGFIKMDDILGRVDESANLKKRATIQELGEFISPEAIKARHAAITAGGAQAQSAGELVGPQTESAKLKLEREKWDTVFGGGVNAYQQYGPWFGHGEVPMRKDGSPDFQEMGRIGQTFRQPMYLAEIAKTGLKADPGQSGEYLDKASNKKYKIVRNAFGVDITPGSPGEAYYKSLLSMMPGVTPGPGQSKPSAKAAAFPSNAHSGFPMPGGVVPGSTPQAAPTDLVSPQTAPAPAAAPADLVQPAATPGLGQYDPALGQVTEIGRTRDEARGTLEKNQSFKIWEGNKGNIDAFHNHIQTIRTSNDPQVKLEAERGLIYTLSELWQNQASGSIPRSILHNWEDIVAKEPLDQRIKNILGKVTGSSPLSHAQIDALIKSGESAIKAKTSAAMQSIKFVNEENPEALQDDEKRLLETNGESEIKGERAFGKPGTASDAIKAGDIQPAHNAKPGEARVIRGVTRYATGKKGPNGWPLYSLTPP